MPSLNRNEKTTRESYRTQITQTYTKSLVSSQEEMLNCINLLHTMFQIVNNNQGRLDYPRTVDTSKGVSKKQMQL